MVVELKSLNARFFETACKIPSSLSFLEIPIVNCLKKKLIRGRVFLTIRAGGSGDAFERVVPVEKVVKDYVKAAVSALVCFGIGGELAASHSKGPGSFKVNFYDEIYNLNKEKIERMTKIEEKKLKLY